MSDRENLVKKVLSDFDNVIVDLEALNDYYIQTRDSITTKKGRLSGKYEIAIEISKLMDSVYEADPEDKLSRLESIKSTEIKPGVLVQDVIDINFNSDQDTLQYSLHDDYRGAEFDPSTARKKKKYVYNQENIFAKSILSNIIISFEQFLASVYETLVLYNPKCYFEDKKIPVCELLEGNLGDILGKMIEREIESNMFDSLNALDKIKEKNSVDVDRFIPIRKEFEEIYYRRNVFVHNAGYVNDKYLDNVSEKYKSSVSMGQKLICDSYYLDNAISVLYKIIASLHYEILNAISSDNEHYDSLANLGFEALQNENYSLAKYIYGILRRHRSFQYINKAMYEVNYINALKLQGKDVVSLLESFDVSIATDDFKIAKECLLDNNEKVYELLTQTYPNSFCALMIREWPIFIKFRETEFYQKFISEHQEDFDKFIFEKETDDE